jgi:very-short-patch-repair endonuclease
VERGLDHAIAALAAEQHGVVSLEQLVAVGLSTSAVSRRARSGRLHRLHPGVFAVGHPRVSRHGRWMAATLASGPDALLSHASAAHAWGLTQASGEVIDVAVPGRSGRAGSRGLRVHRPLRLAAEARAVVDGIPVTDANRALFDVAPLLALRPLGRAFARAEELGLLDVGVVRQLLETHPRRAGAPKLRALVGTPVRLTRSELETRFLELLDAHGLPRPEVNTVVGPYTPDFLWPAHRVVVEADGWEHHGDRLAFRADRARDRHLIAWGYAVVRVTYEDVVGTPGRTARELRAVLAARVERSVPRARSRPADGGGGRTAAPAGARRVQSHAWSSARWADRASSSPSSGSGAWG